MSLMVTMEKAYRAEDMKNNRNRAINLLTLAKKQSEEKGLSKFVRVEGVVPTWKEVFIDQ